MAQCEILVEMTTYEEVTERADRTHLAWERNSLSDSCPSNSHSVDRNGESGLDDPSGITSCVQRGGRKNRSGIKGNYGLDDLNRQGR